MRIIKLLLITLCTLAFSCQRYDDSAVWDELKAHAERIAALEALCAEMNSNITALDEIVAALQGNEYVTEITDITENGKVIGYTITFSKRGRVAIYHGKAGVPGAPGAPGQDGEDGTDGKDGHTPVIGVRKDADGVYYWTLDGEWLRDTEGNKIPTTGKDGADGQPGTPGADGQPGAPGTDGDNGEQGKPGQDGADGITPLLKIEDDYWYISYDNGQTWQQLYKAVGEDGAAGANGTDGAPGKDGHSFFQSVDTTNPNYIILTLSDGTAIKIPTWKAFEELQTKVNQMNTNLAALQTILEAIQNSDYVTEITTAIENGKEVGYTIHFSKSQPVTIYHGKDGVDGAPGQDGTPGQDGEDGKDGYTPVVSVKQDTDDNYYWTVDGEWMSSSDGEDNWVIEGGWLTDGQGNKIPATGKNGVTPVLKILDGHWYISYDNGKTWSDEPLGPATAEVEGDIFSDISYDDAYLYVTVSSGETLIISRHVENLLELLDISPAEITDRSATFIGSFNVPDKDLAYSQVTVYYSDAETFSTFEAKSAQTALFDYNKSFTIYVSGLKADTRYSYCVCIKVRGEEVYGDIKEFVTEETPTFKLTYENGTLQNGGYYNTDVRVNGFVTPLPKEDIPETINRLRFYLRGMEDGDVRDITAEIGFFTGESISTSSYVPLKSVTVPVTLNQKFTQTDFDLECTRKEILSAMDSYPEAIYWGAAFYLSADYPASEIEGEGYSYCVGAGTFKEDDKTRPMRLYRQKNKWKPGTTAQRIYVGALTVVPSEK